MSKRLPIPKDAKLTHVGYFEVECGRVHITDPCYKEGTWCSAPNYYRSQRTMECKCYTS